MSEFVITVILVVSLGAILIFLKKRKACSSCCSSKATPKSEPKAPEQVKQQPETKTVADAETVSVNLQITEPKTAIASAADGENSFLPQDSVLKRHYISHVSSIIASLASPRPTDSVLSRHYDAMIATKIVQCLNDKKAMEQLIHDYENRT